MMRGQMKKVCYYIVLCLDRPELHLECGHVTDYPIEDPKEICGQTNYTLNKPEYAYCETCAENWL